MCVGAGRGGEGNPIPYSLFPIPYSLFLIPVPNPLQEKGEGEGEGGGE